MVPIFAHTSFTASLGHVPAMWVTLCTLDYS